MKLSNCIPLFSSLGVCRQCAITCVMSREYNQPLTILVGILQVYTCVRWKITHWPTVHVLPRIICCAVWRVGPLGEANNWKVYGLHFNPWLRMCSNTTKSCCNGTCSSSRVLASARADSIRFLMQSLATFRRLLLSTNMGFFITLSSGNKQGEKGELKIKNSSLYSFEQ